MFKGLFNRLTATEEITIVQIDTKKSKAIDVLIEKTKTGEMFWERYLNFGFKSIMNDDLYILYNQTLGFQAGNLTCNEYNIGDKNDTIRLYEVIKEGIEYSKKDKLSKIYNKILTE